MDLADLGQMLVAGKPPVQYRLSAEVSAGD